MGEKKDMGEEITLDFSWLKNIFSGEKKKNPKKKTKRSKDEEDITIDLNQITSFLKKYSTILLILIPIFLSIYIRTLPASIPIAEDWARQSIKNTISNNVATQVNQQYPNLNPETKQNMINSQVNTVLQQQAQEIEQAVKVQADQIRERFKDDTGITYLGDIDSYYWLRYTRNIIEKGMYGDEIQDGEPFDNHMKAPRGLKVEKNLYPYFEAALFKLISTFDKSFSYIQTAFYTPMVLSFFAIVAAFLIGKKISGNLAGLIASILIAVNPTVLSRSLGSDNDIVNAVFPLLIMLFVIYAFDTKKTRNRAVFAALAGTLIGAYSFAWSGWWFMFQFIIGATFIYAGYIFVYEIINNKNKKNSFLTVFQKNETLKQIYVFLGLFFIFSVLSLFLFGDGHKFLGSFNNPIRITQIKAAAQGTNIWPNVYTTVAELNAANVPQILASLGGKNFFWIALVGSLVSLVNFNTEGQKKKINMLFLVISSLYLFIFVGLASQNTLGIFVLLGLFSLPLWVGLLLSIIFDYKLDPQHSILLTIWFMATIYASTKGVRFILLIIPAFVVSFATFFGKITHWFSEFISENLDISKTITKTMFFILISVVLIQPIRIGYDVAYSYAPSVSDAWVESLTKIKEESQPDAIINSWWDFGHWFKYFGDRQVTFDGASQNSQQAHWIGKVLLTDDEDQAIAILRMLDCSATGAENKINEIIGDRYQTVVLLYELLDMSEDQTRQKLITLTDEQKTEEILNEMYCSPPENYFITSGDMVGKSGVWAHFGSWDFKKAKVYSTYKTQEFNGFINILTNDLGFSSDEAQRKYYELNSLTSDSQINNWIAPWPSYGGTTGCAKIDNTTLQCNIPQQNQQYIPLLINLTSMDAYVLSQQGNYYPNTFGYVEQGELKIKKYDGNKLGYSAVLREDKKGIILMSPELTGSIFTRLYYLNGLGLSKFEKFYDTTSIDGTRIITWKIDWDE